MKSLLITLLLVGTVRALEVPDWEATYSQEYAAAIAPEPIVIDRIVVVHLRVEKIDVATVSVEHIRLVKLFVDHVGRDALTVFTFKEITNIARYLKYGFDSPWIKEYVKNKQWDRLKAELTGIVAIDDKSPEFLTPLAGHYYWEAKDYKSAEALYRRLAEASVNPKRALRFRNNS